ncbi:GntR family transcriptional regulator [Tepidibacter formicigenes]|jgi:GntR family transcriptional regulator|uniref:GntR family transcriptional regulator n=1 Tax=Tepidibacter formicigenes DSM 15518 TaxID=1123349 RepID=A0A1M6J7H6_9FIRM|nr:GntR family transcriptional regulator [Tepidibacter formicigenes]SHJ42654.1 GntR family transcriptional regulator [Tepidibacter formicigenes DSM 15518]
MFELDLRSRLPIYEQLVEKFKELIINEVLKTDEKLPSVRMLARNLTINPNTIQKAYRELERQGYIYSIKGKGSFVNPSEQISNHEKLLKIKKELVKILSEALYLGMKKEDIIQMLSEIEDGLRGGE